MSIKSFGTKWTSHFNYCSFCPPKAILHQLHLFKHKHTHTRGNRSLPHLIALWPKHSGFPLSSPSLRVRGSSHLIKPRECTRVCVYLFIHYTLRKTQNHVCVCVGVGLSVCVLSHRYPRKHLLIAGECWIDAQSICGFVWDGGCARSAESGGHWPLRSRALWRTMARPGTKWTLEKRERESEEEKRRGMGRGAGV